MLVCFLNYSILTLYFIVSYYYTGEPTPSSILKLFDNFYYNFHNLSAYSFKKFKIKCKLLHLMHNVLFKLSLLFFFGFLDEGNVVQHFLVFIFVGFFNNANEIG